MGQLNQTAIQPTVAPLLIDWMALTGDRFAMLSDLTARNQVLLVMPVDEPISLLDLFRTGVRGVVTAGSEPPAIELAARAVAAGGCHISAELAGRLDTLFEPTGENQAPLLTIKEIEVVRYIALGLTHRQIARRLGVSEATVHTHAKRLRRKLGATNKADLTRRAIQLGYAEHIGKPATVS